MKIIQPSVELIDDLNPADIFKDKLPVIVEDIQPC